MAKAILTIPDAWVSDDSDLFVVTGACAQDHRYDQQAEYANRALEESGCDERMSWGMFASIKERTYVDPAFILAERWPDSATSSSPVEGWVELYCIDVSGLPVPQSADVAIGCNICGEALPDAEPHVCKPVDSEAGGN